MNKRNETVPNNLKEYRLKAGLTQRQVAQKLGLQCEDRLSRWERGQALPTIINLAKLAKIYDTSIDSIAPHNI